MLRDVFLWTLAIIGVYVMFVMLDKALSSPAFVELLRAALESKYD